MAQRHVETMWQRGENWWTLALNGLSPVWFTSVMGTGILALAATLSPVRLPVLEGAGVALWLADTALFAGLLLLWVMQGLRRPARIMASLRELATAQAWGAPPMACFTVASGSPSSPLEAPRFSGGEESGSRSDGPRRAARSS